MNSRTAEFSSSDSLSEEIRSAWRQLPEKGLFFSLLAAWLVLFHFLGNSTMGYVNTPSLMGWMYDGYMHAKDAGDDAFGMFIPFLVVGLLWWKRWDFLGTPHRVWGTGLLLLGVATLLHLLGYVIMQPRISIVAMFAGIYALIGLAWGPGWMLRSFFPFFLFAFMMPLGSLTEKVTFPLRIFVSWIVEHLFNDVLGVSVLRQGTQLFNGLGTFQFEVAAACSGIRSLVSIFLIATIYGFLVFKTPLKRIIMVASALPLAVIGNVLRLSCIVAAGEFRGQAAGNFVHENGFFSISPYIPAILGVMYIGRWLEKMPDAQRQKPEATKV